MAGLSGRKAIKANLLSGGYNFNSVYRNELKHELKKSPGLTGANNYLLTPEAPDNNRQTIVYLIYTIPY